MGPGLVVQWLEIVDHAVASKCAHQGRGEPAGEAGPYRILGMVEALHVPFELQNDESCVEPGKRIAIAGLSPSP